MSSDKGKKISAAVDNRLDDLFGEDTQEAERFENKETESAVNSRLDDLFGDEPAEKIKKPKPTPKKVQEQKKPPKSEPISMDDSPISELKSVVLSLEWEITDQIMQKLDTEVKKLEKHFKADKILVAFLQLLGSLGKYVQKKKANAHPDSIMLLHSVYENLEKAISDTSMTDVAKKKMLISEVTKYKKLKEHIAVSKTAQKVEKKPPEVKEVVAEEVKPEPAVPVGTQEPEIGFEEPVHSKDIAGAASHQDIVNMLKDINKTLSSELRALREELKLLRKR